MSETRAILWDFDGTLAERPGTWRSCLLEVLDEHEPGHRVTADDVRPFLQDGFPWHSPDRPHPELNSAGAWWKHVSALLARAYEGIGFSPMRAQVLSQFAAAAYPDPRAWRLFEDTVPALRLLKAAGWRHVVLSNHVPELPAIIACLGIAELLDASITSAATGFEKPHPEAFAIGRRAAGDPDILWMVGDNPHADVAGAEASGIPAILVDRTATVGPSARAVSCLSEVAGWL